MFSQQELEELAKAPTDKHKGELTELLAYIGNGGVLYEYLFTRVLRRD